MKLGIYIGSFNPVHIGHIDVVNYLINNGYVDRVLIVPTTEYWHKNTLAPLEDRINMLKFFENEVIKIDTNHNNYKYTSLLMKKLKEEYKDTLHLILGADNIVSFDKWHNYEELLEYNILVMPRDNIDIYKYIEKLHGNFIVVDDYKYIDISSTEIRKEEVNEYLDPKVLGYIKSKKLYKNN